MRSGPIIPSKQPALPPAGSQRKLWLGYTGACLLTWLLFVLAGTELQRGTWELWEAVYQATTSLWAPMLLGAAVYPVAAWLQRKSWPSAAQLACHAGAAIVFSEAWLAGNVLLAWGLFGLEHAEAMLEQNLVWRLIWGVLVYAALATGFVSVLNARQARASAVAAAQAESALARAELAAISGKLNPHFLFNTLNSLIALTRKDAKAAEQGLLRFSGMLRYVLASKREASDRVALQEEIDFVRDYLTLEALRLGQRLRVEWQLDTQTLGDDIPPLTLQPLVENCILHGIAPRAEGGCISISARRDALTQGLALTVQDDGAGCDPALLEQPRPGRGIGLSALKRRFALDFEGRARLRVHTAPGQGFRVDLWIPQT